MKKILVIGAGLSSACLIRYLLSHAARENWQVTVADQQPELARQRVGRFARGKAVQLNITDKAAREQLIRGHDLIVSLLPPALHLLAAKDCVKFGRHLITASYVSPEIRQLHTQALKAGVLLLNEIGLDPGIDHLSAMELIDDIHEKGGTVRSFRSYCGGLVAPEYDDNPWNYKFTWNPRNVVLAGQAAARYTHNGRVQYIPASRMFTQTETVRVKGFGTFEAYANRDSNGYIAPYGIQQAHTVLRGTLRRKGFCHSWNHLVQLGLTDDQLQLDAAATITWRSLLESFLPEGEGSAEQRTCRLLGIPAGGNEFKKLNWLGLFSDTPVAGATPAQALQHLLQQHWALRKGELDMIVMQHQLEYELNGKLHRHQTSLVVKGEDATYTAMAQTVGLPMAIAARLLLSGKITQRGVVIPVHKEIYAPVLEELKTFGIRFFRG